MAEWLERVVAVQESSGSSPAKADIKTFADVGNLLTTSVSAGLSNDSGSYSLSQEQRTNISLETLYTLEMGVCPFPTDGAHFIPIDQ